MKAIREKRGSRESERAEEEGRVGHIESSRWRQLFGLPLTWRV